MLFLIGDRLQQGRLVVLFGRRRGIWRCRRRNARLRGLWGQVVPKSYTVGILTSTEDRISRDLVWVLEMHVARKIAAQGVWAVSNERAMVVASRIASREQRGSESGVPA